MHRDRNANTLTEDRRIKVGDTLRVVRLIRYSFTE